MAAEALTLHDEIKMSKNEDELLLNLDPERVLLEYKCVRLQQRLRDSDEINEKLTETIKKQNLEINNLKEIIASYKEEIDSILGLVKTMEAEHEREIMELKKSVS